jgi:hypothetical protein
MVMLACCCFGILNICVFIICYCLYFIHIFTTFSVLLDTAGQTNSVITATSCKMCLRAELSSFIYSVGSIAVLTNAAIGLIIFLCYIIS